MIEPVRPHEPRVPVSPALAVRVALIGGVALALFAIIFFRLWYLQILTGDQYLAKANINRLRTTAIAAPRGDIVDRNGQPIVSDRSTIAVQLDPSLLPARGAPRRELYRRLGYVLQMNPRQIQALYQRAYKLAPYAPATIKTDPPTGVLSYLKERADRFPGVTERQIFLRDYPFGSLAAQVLGYVSQISGPELKFSHFRGVQQGTVVGQYGLEYRYDHYLRGNPGQQRIEVDAAGHPIAGAQVAQTDPTPGEQLKLSLDAGLERAGDAALLSGIGLAHGLGNPADAGAYVALDPRDGEVLAMGSYPTFDPNIFARPLTQTQYNNLTGNGNSAAAPLLNRAIAGGYPTGSTFKPITAIAALTGGVITPSTTMGGGQCVAIGAAGQQFCNAGKANYGDLDLRDAIKVSEDTYFYLVGAMANAVPGEIIQKTAHRLGIGQPTGIDLPGEFNGVIPDKAWRARQGALEAACERRTHKSFCGISDKRPWSVGDNVNLAVGQGDLLTNPLQMAVAYSTLVNAFNSGGHGWVVRPHLGLEVDDSQGRLIQKIAPQARRAVSLDPGGLGVVFDGLHAATSEPGGTSTDVWNGFPLPVYGKTGTAQHTGSADQSWYMAYIPGPPGANGQPTRPIVIAVTIEKGGFGAQAAAPAARLIASQWFGIQKKLVAGSSKTL